MKGSGLTDPRHNWLCFSFGRNKRSCFNPWEGVISGICGLRLLLGRVAFCGWVWHWLLTCLPFLGRWGRLKAHGTAFSLTKRTGDMSLVKDFSATFLVSPHRVITCDGCWRVYFYRPEPYQLGPKHQPEPKPLHCTSEGLWGRWGTPLPLGKPGSQRWSFTSLQVRQLIHSRKIMKPLWPLVSCYKWLYYIQKDIKNTRILIFSFFL